MSRRDKKKDNKKDKKSRSLETSIVTYCFLMIFIAMAAYLAYFIYFESDNYYYNSYNARLVTESEKVIRGDILSADGKVLATTEVDSEGNETRVYEYGSLFAHAIGYSTNGMMGVELDANYKLLTSNSNVFERLSNELSEEKNQGDTVVTTLDVSLQKACYNALGDYDGAVICIEPSTGKILAMVSKPDFDPNTISEDWEDIVDENSGSSALLNRATQGLYTPGSIFKIFTLNSFLDLEESSSFSYYCKALLTVDDYKLHCYGSIAHGTLDLKSAFANSCNGSFATIGLTLGAEQLIEDMEGFFFNTDLPTELSNTAVSKFALDLDADDVLLAQTSMGQGDTLVSPLQMAMVVSAICNGGEMKVPYIVDYIQNSDGEIVSTHKDSSTKYVLFSSERAAILEEYMRAVVTDGTATNLDVAEYTVYGKTGTAELDSDGNLENSWFVGYARDDDGNELVVALVYEGISSGSIKAKYAVIDIFNEYFVY